MVVSSGPSRTEITGAQRTPEISAAGIGKGRVISMGDLRGRARGAGSMQGSRINPIYPYDGPVGDSEVSLSRGEPGSGSRNLSDIGSLHRIAGLHA